MENKNLLKRIKYKMDCMLSKGAITLSFLLLLITIIVAVIVGILASFISNNSGIYYQIWNSLMHIIDPGNIASVSTDNKIYLLLMFLTTLLGMVLTSVLIGIISSGFENKLNNLRRGTSVVREKNHTVIIGFNENVYVLLKELIEANSNKTACIVVLGEQSKQEMEYGYTTIII